MNTDNKRLYNDVAERIVALIDSGQYPPGSRLPGERDLAEQLGVSRVTVREAQIALQAKNRIEIRSGSGSRVLERPSADALPPLEPFELTQARALVESEAAALAATMITDAELDALDALVAQMGAETEPESALAQDADREFHMAIARATQNAAIVDAIARLWRYRTEIPAIVQAYEAICERNAGARLQEHGDVVKALRNRNPIEARQAMRRHFTCILEAMLSATEERAIEDARRRSHARRERYLTGELKSSEA
jgi:DNA-binding FadR family transcriptional regulator